MERLAKESHLWTTMNLEDPDRLPTIIGIPARDKRLRYRFVLIRDKGQKRAMICYTPRTSYGQIKLNRKTMVLPDQPFLTHEEADRIASEYDARRERGTGQ